jgi:hypothetical protein
MYTHIYIGLTGHPNVYIQKIHRPIDPCRISIQKIGSPAYIIKKVYKTASYNQGASRAPPAAPPSGGGGGPPPPAPGGGGGTSAGPPYPGGRRPLVIAASTAARRMIDRHGGGNPMHCSRNSSSWIWVHMPSGTSRSTVSNRRTRSSSSTPAVARRSMRWPRTRVIKTTPLRWSLGPCWSPSSLIPWTPPCTRRSLLLSLRRCSEHLHLTPARCQICTCTKQTNSRWYQCLYIKHMHWYIKITK